MNDVSPSDDELVSSYLDGEASPEEVARVEADPGLLARAEEMRAAIELTATPVSIPELDLARIRAAAVAASDTSSVVRDLQAAGAERSRRHQQRTRMLAIAAAFVFFGIAVTAIRSIETGDNDTADAGSSAVRADASTGDDGDEAGDDSGGLDALGAADAADEEERELATEAAPLADTASAAAAETNDDAEGDDGGGAEAEGDDADVEIAPQDFFDRTAEFDVLPALLEPSADLDALHVQIRTITATFLANGESTLPKRDDPIDPPCADDFLVLLTDLDFAAADIALASVAGDDVIVVVARDQVGDLFTLTAFTGACDDIQVEGLTELG